MTTTPITPEPIMRVAHGFMAAKHLFAASELGLFDALAASPADLDALAARTGLTRRTARISADAMVALGLLERDGEAYRNSPSADAYLVGPDGLRPLLRFWDKISYPTWEHLTPTLAEGTTPHQVFEFDEEAQAIISAGIEAVLVGPSLAFADSPELDGRLRLLDVGGGTGSWAIAAARRHPELSALVLELPVTAEIARKRIADAGLSDRVDTIAADVLTDPVPTGFDVFLAANLMHYFSPEVNRRVLSRIRDAAPDGAVLMLADFWTDPTHTEPLPAALMAGEFAVHVRDGDVYSVEEVDGWLAETGWRFENHRVLAGPQSLIVATAS